MSYLCYRCFFLSHKIIWGHVCVFCARERDILNFTLLWVMFVSLLLQVFDNPQLARKWTEFANASEEQQNEILGTSKGMGMRRRSMEDMKTICRETGTYICVCYVYVHVLYSMSFLVSYEKQSMVALC